MFNLGALLRKQPEDVVAFFEAKGLKVSWNWEEVWQEANAKAFTVARANRLTVLKDIHDEMRRAVKEGVPKREFVKTLTPRLKARGWWGKVVEVDPRGRARTVQLGSPYRLKFVYRQNMQSGYMAARWKAQKENADARPFWQYVAVLDSRTRPGHRALDGKVFPHDDPFWDSFYPPNGFNCRCRVRTLSDRRLKAKGLKPESSTGKISEAQVLISRRTGELRPVKTFAYRGPDFKRRTFRPDPGWSHNPARASLWDHAGGLEGKGGAKLAKGQSTWKDIGLSDIRDMPARPAPKLLPKGKTRAEALLIMAREWNVMEGPRAIKTPVETVHIWPEHLTHIAEKMDGRERYARLALATLEKPDEVWLSQYSDGSFRHQYIGVFEKRRRQYEFVSVRVNTDGSLLWNTFPSGPKYINGQRAGLLVHENEKK